MSRASARHDTLPLEWLLDSDPSIRWQVMRDFSDEPADVVAAERSRVASEGWGARLLDQQRPDGSWGDDVATPRWRSNLFTLLLLRSLGLDPTSARARKAIDLVRDRVTWGPEFGDSPFFEGEVEPCINGGVVALGGYFGETRDRLVDRLLAEQLADGGWNCEAERGSEAVGLVVDRRQPDGRWLLDEPHRDALHDLEGGPGQPSRWNTLRALRVLHWSRTA